MIKQILLGVAFIIAGTGFSFSQHTAHHHFDEEGYAPRYCHTTEAQEELIQNNPDIAPLIELAEAELERFTESFSVSEYDASRSGGNYIIPVVFHIVHANGSENISDEQINDAIEVLTRDFTMGNSDTSAVISEFKSIIADVGIEFRLAKRDPSGNCTNGIVRTVSNLTHSGGENLKSISPIWPRNKYLNVWVAADLSSGAAGYTYNPGSVDGMWGAGVDGIVMKSSYVGRVGTGSETRSRTLTHEVGHWLNLRHTWGGTNNPGLPENCFTDDNVADTPNTIGWTTCVIYGESCGGLDNVQNYMEYSYCSKMFTEGQKARMLAALNSSTASRNNLHATSNLVATGVLNSGDLCMVKMESSKEVICVGEAVTYQDLSYHNVASRTWIFEGGTPATSTDEEVEVIYENSGVYPVILEVVSNTGETITETFENTVTVLPGEGIPLDYSENFEGSSSGNLGNEWQIIENGANHQWQISSQVSGASGSKALFLPNRNLPAGTISEIISQPINLSNTTTDVEITFKYAYARRNSGNLERLKFWVSSNCGESWSLRGIWSNNFSTIPSFTNAFWIPSSSGHWETVTINNLSESHLVSNFRFKIEFESDGGNNLFIDDINISGPTVSNVETHQVSYNVSVYPNPANSYFNLNVSGDKPSRLSMQLLNTLGQAVWATEQLPFAGGSQQYEINTSDLSPGVYLLYIENDDGKRTIQRVVISSGQ